MCDCMIFPDTVEEFIERYKVKDDKEIYTNGVDLIPVFRIKQWMYHHMTPTADVEEVRHGKWTENEDGILYCSECKEEALYKSIFEEQFDYDWEENLVPCGYEEHKEYIKTNYCPNCGAKMDGGDNNA